MFVAFFIWKSSHSIYRFTQPRPQGFSLKKWVGRRPTHFLIPGDEIAFHPLLSQAQH